MSDLQAGFVSQYDVSETRRGLERTKVMNTDGHPGLTACAPQQLQCHQVVIAELGLLLLRQPQVNQVVKRTHEVRLLFWRRDLPAQIIDPVPVLAQFQTSPRILSQQEARLVAPHTLRPSG